MDCTTEDSLAYYDLSGLSAEADYVVDSPMSHNLFKLNVCQAVKSQLWNVDSLPEDQVAAFYRGKHGDFALGSMASTNLTVIDGSPVMYLRDGSPCPGLSGSGEKGPAMLANTAIRFVCEPTTFGIGTPKLIAQFPMDDEQSCSFYFEWRTHYACPSSRKAAGVLHLFILFAALVFIALAVYFVCITLYNRFFLGLRGLDQFPSLPCSPLRFFSWAHDKITGRGDGIIGGPPLHSSMSNGSSGGTRWFGRTSNGGGGWFGKWGRKDRNGYRQIPEEEEGILNDTRSDDEEERAPRIVNLGEGFENENAWAGVRGNGMGRDGVIRL